MSTDRRNSIRSADAGTTRTALRQIGLAAIVVTIVFGAALVMRGHFPATLAADAEGEVFLPALANHIEMSPPPAPGPSRGGWTNYSSATSTLAVAASSDGRHVWTATWGGTAVWDTSTGVLEVFSSVDGLLSNTQWDVAVTDEGTAWLASDDGVSRWDPSSGWTIFPHWQHAALEQSHAIAVAPDGSVYAGGWHGLSRFDVEEGWTTLAGLPRGIGYVEDIVFGSDGEMWLAAESGAHSRDAEGRWRTFDSSDGLATDHAAVVFVDKAGDAWVGCARPQCREEDDPQGCGGVSRIADDGTVTTYTEADGLGMNFVNAIAQDAEGGMWFGSHEMMMPESAPRVSGLSRLAPDGGFHVYPYADGTPLNHVSDLDSDESGTLWIATDDGVVRRSPGGGWATHHTRHLDTLPGGVAQVIFDSVMGSDGRLWLGTRKGVVLLDPDGSWTHLPIDGNWYANYVESVELDDAGQLWVGTLNGLYMLDPRDGFAWREPPGWRNVAGSYAWGYDIEAGTRGEMWIGTSHSGAFRRFPGGEWVSYTEPELPSDDVIDIDVGADGTAWIATSGGVAVSSPSGTVAPLDDPDGPACEKIRDLAVDADGAVWFGTSFFGCNTVSKLEPDGTWLHYPSRDGHGLNTVAEVAVDSRGAVWLGSWDGRGVSALGTDGIWRRYRTDTGLAHGDVWTITPSVGRDGRLEMWFGTLAGLSLLRPDEAGSDPP